MNPETNQFEELTDSSPDMTAEQEAQLMKSFRVQFPDPGNLARPNGEPVPPHWLVYTVGENVVVRGSKEYAFKVAHIGEKHMLLEPVGLVSRR